MNHETNIRSIKQRAGKENETHAGLGDDPPRRRVLRGALATGCCLLMPLALPGCDAGEEAASGDGAAPMADPASAGLPEGEQARISQASVQYQAQPNGEQNCAGCMYFIVESNTCKKVEGDISPAGWCVIWAKAGPGQPPA